MRYWWLLSKPMDKATELVCTISFWGISVRILRLGHSYHMLIVRMAHTGAAWTGSVLYIQALLTYLPIFVIILYVQAFLTHFCDCFVCSSISDPFFCDPRGHNMLLNMKPCCMNNMCRICHVIWVLTPVNMSNIFVCL